jgi:phosphoribosylformylglycinamidine synthase
MLGANLDISNLSDENLRDDELLFSESHGRFIIETQPKDLNIVLELAEKNEVTVEKIGKVSNDQEIVVDGLKSNSFKIDLEKLKGLYKSTIPDLMEI